MRTPPAPQVSVRLHASAGSVFFPPFPLQLPFAPAEIHSTFAGFLGFPWSEGIHTSVSASMSKFDTNPFDEGGESSSNAAPVPKSGLGSFFDKAGAAVSSMAASFDSVALTPKVRPLPSSFPLLYPFLAPYSDIVEKETQLAAREQELKRREEELTQREASLGIQRNNFPPFFPLIQHDISADIPSHVQYMQYPAFASWLGIILCLVFNLVAVIVSWVLGAVSSTSGMGNFFLAIIYGVLGIPLSYILWYRRLYNSLKKDSALGFGIFFLGYLIHCGFCIFASVAPPIFFSGLALTGVLSTISVFGNSVTTGIFFAVGTALFIGETCLSIYTLGASPPSQSLLHALLVYPLVLCALRLCTS
ncbi:unnamed protein product [Closterium sp. Yama58-4]|nr:unnamed protein product [Closterium sp. Yama58-4]